VLPAALRGAAACSIPSDLNRKEPPIPPAIKSRSMTCIIRSPLFVLAIAVFSLSIDFLRISQDFPGAPEFNILSDFF
jgi:hypothetical protein